MSSQLKMAILISVTILISVFSLVYFNNKPPANIPNVQSAEFDTKDAQTAEIIASGGYKPDLIELKADKPSVIKINTQNNYDCSREIVIPALKINKILDPTGTYEVKIPPQKAGTTINGTCGMGMYSFKIKFT